MNILTRTPGSAALANQSLATRRVRTKIIGACIAANLLLLALPLAATAQFSGIYGHHVLPKFIPVTAPLLESKGLPIGTVLIEQLDTGLTGEGNRS